MALIAVPIASAATIRTRRDTLASGDPSGTHLRIRTAATITSARFPTVWPTAEPIGSDV